jgi:hypothetical protein
MPVATGLLPSLSRAANTYTSDLQDNSGAFAGIYVFAKVTVPNGGSVTVTVQGYDETTGTYFDLLVGAAISTATTQVLLVYPGVTKVTNLIDDRPLPMKYRVSCVVATAAVTFSVSAQLIP